MTRKTLLQLIQTVASELNLPQPVVVLSSQNQNVKKLYALLIALCDELAREYPFQVLQKRYTFSTTDGVEAYDFPSDILRVIDATMFDTNNRWSLNGSLTPTQWESFKNLTPTTSPYTRFRVYQDQLWLDPVPGTTVQTFVYNYISGSYVEDSSTGDLKAEFEADSDKCVFDPRLVVYGVKLKWMRSINADTTNAADDFNRVFALAKAQDKPAPRLIFNGGSTGTRLIDNANLPESNFTG